MTDGALAGASSYAQVRVREPMGTAFLVRRPRSVVKDPISSSPVSVPERLFESNGVGASGPFTPPATTFEFASTDAL